MILITGIKPGQRVILRTGNILRFKSKVKHFDFYSYTFMGIIDGVNSTINYSSGGKQGRHLITNLYDIVEILPYIRSDEEWALSLTIEETFGYKM